MTELDRAWKHLRLMQLKLRLARRFTKHSDHIHTDLLIVASMEQSVLAALSRVWDAQERAKPWLIDHGGPYDAWLADCENQRLRDLWSV